MADGISLRSQMRRWCKEVIEAEDDFDVAAKAREGANLFAKDQKFAARFCAEFAPSVLYDMLKHLLAEDRRHVMHGAHAVTREAVRASLEREVVDWSRWFEYDAKTGKQVRLLEMTWEQLGEVPLVRETRARADLERAALARLLRGRMKPGQRVSEVWTEEEVSDLASKIQVSHQFSVKGASAPPVEVKGAAD